MVLDGISAGILVEAPLSFRKTLRAKIVDLQSRGMANILIVASQIRGELRPNHIKNLFVNPPIFTATKAGPV